MTGTETRLALRQDDLVWQVVDGDIVVLDFPEGSYFAINRTGAVLWEALRSGTTRSELVATMCHRYGIEAAQAEREVDEFVGQLATKRLLE